MSFEKLRTVARVAEVTAIFGKIEDIGKKAAALENDTLFNHNHPSNGWFALSL